jgi:hypothetical protein
VRPDLGGLELEGLYRHSTSGDWVESIGIATMFELDAEQVGLFRFVPPAAAGPVWSQRSETYDQGERFTPADEALVNDPD